MAPNSYKWLLCQGWIVGGKGRQRDRLGHTTVDKRTLSGTRMGVIDVN